MLLITIPLVILVALFGFLFDSFYSNKPKTANYVSRGNVMLYHDAMYSYASGWSVTQTGNVITGTPPYFNNITYTQMGDYQANIITDGRFRYLITSFNTINGSTVIANKTIKSIAEQLQTPTSGLNQNYQVKIALINNGCNATILNAGLNAGTHNVVEPSIYAPIFNQVCTEATSPIKTNVIMEQIQ
jgi:hypothetical protein